MRRKIHVFVAVLVGGVMVAGAAAAATSPSVVTGGTTGVGQTSATLHGAVNPNGSSTTYFFQWGLTNGYGDNGKPHSAGSGTKTTSVTETAGGLTPGTTYHYRLVATNQFGTTVGADRKFKTAGHPPPGATTGPATALGTHGATLTGTINPSGAATTYYFQWGGTSAYGQRTTPQTLAAGNTPENVSDSSLQGLLSPGTIYHYRLVATHAGVISSFGADGSFMTYPSPRPVPGVTAGTKPHRAARRPYVLNTSGRIIEPSSIPAQYACQGNVTIRFFKGIKQVKFTLAPVQSTCGFAAQTVFPQLPKHSRAPVHLRVVIRYISTPYLATNRARYEHITLG